MLQAVLIGHLGADVEIKEANGRKFAVCRVAHSESYKDTQGNKVERTTWVDVTVNSYERIAPYLKRGTMVYVAGNLATRVYSSEKDRCYKAGITIMATTINLLSAKKEDGRSATEQKGSEYDGF